MNKLRNPIRICICMCVLLLGLTAGMVHAEDISINAKKQDVSRLTTENSATDLASDSSMTADAKNPEDVVKSDCDSNTVMETLGIKTLLSENEENMVPSSWICGSCSVSACAGKSVGSYCGSGKYCVVSIVCPTQPYTDKCVCGTDHF